MTLTWSGFRRRRSPWMTQRPKTPRCLDAWIDLSRRSVCQTVPPRLDWISGSSSNRIFDRVLALHKLSPGSWRIRAAWRRNKGSTSDSLALDACSLFSSVKGAGRRTQNLGHFAWLPCVLTACCSDIGAFGNLDARLRNSGYPAVVV